MRGNSHVRFSGEGGRQRRLLTRPRSRRKERKNATAAVGSMEKWATWTCCPLFHRPYRVKKEKNESKLQHHPNHKIPIEENGAKKRKKSEGKSYSSK